MKTLEMLSKYRFPILTDCLPFLSKYLLHYSYSRGSHGIPFIPIFMRSKKPEHGEQLIIAVTWLYNVYKMFSLSLHDTSGSSKLTDNYNISDSEIQQLNANDGQLAHPSNNDWPTDFGVYYRTVCTINVSASSWAYWIVWTSYCKLIFKKPVKHF